MPRGVRVAVGVGLAVCVGVGCLWWRSRQAVSPVATGSVVNLLGATMGTTYTVKLPALPGGVTAATLQAEVDRILEDVNDQMSTYRPASEISRFNAQQGSDWFEVSRATATVVAVAGRLSELTGGAFDCTVAPLVNLFGFGETLKPQQLPERAEVDGLLAVVGYTGVEVRLESPALRKLKPGVTLNLSALAKGYGVDQVAELLTARGVEDFFVEIGGEIRTAGTRYGRRWRLGVEKPEAGLREVYGVVELTGGAMATSGDYRNAFVVDGKRYSHTIDPRTGWPVTHSLTAVSVIAPTCMEADALATAMMVLGPEEGYHLAERLGRGALFLIRTPNGPAERRTSHFPAFSP